MGVMSTQISPQSKPDLCLVDGSSYLYRAFHALPSLTNAQGEPTGALFGVANMLRRLIEQHQPMRVAVVFDASGKNFRHTMYQDYKAHRPPMPDELRCQIEPLYELIDAMGLPRLVIPEVEADDVIATLAHQAKEAGLSVLISSGDKDLAQLVDGGIVVEDSMQNRAFTPEAVEEKFGVPPHLVGDLLALTGDSADNIPGVEKVGPKTAAKWLLQYGDLDGLIAHADEVGGKVGENLRNALATLPLSRALVALKSDVATGVELEALHPSGPNDEALVALLTRFGFSTWLKQYQSRSASKEGAHAVSAPAQSHALSVETVTTQKALDGLVDALYSASLIAVDTETTSLEALEASLVGLSFATEEGKAYYVPLMHHDQVLEFDPGDALNALKPILEDRHRPKVGQNLKYDLNVFWRAGISLDGITHDTMLASYVYRSTGTRHDMDSLASHYLGRTTIPYEVVAGKGKDQRRFDQVDVDKAAQYAGEDAEVTLALHHHLWPRLEAEGLACSVYRDIEMPLMPVLARMERVGVAIDANKLHAQSKELEAALDRLVIEAHTAAGKPFNLSSPKQLQEILFEEQGLPVIRKTPKGQPSTAEDVLQELADDYPLPQLILEHRSLSKLKSTYTDRLPEKINPETGRVHTHYHQAVTATGRLSSQDPNLQNIPIRTEEGRRVRQAFVAPPGRVLLAADYSQIELRIMAHLSKDERLLAAFGAGEDVHRATASEVFDCALDEVSDQQRRAAKAINFGLMYGMSGWGLAKQLDLSRTEATEYIERYFERYPGVRRFMDDIRTSAKAQGYVETIFGRRLWTPDIDARNPQRRQAAERAAINAPMQGSAADIIKKAMIAVDGWLQNESIPALLVMQVHDELVLEVDEGALDRVTEGVVARMMGAAQLAVPLVVDVGHGPNWDSAH
jgi:DNA polymerase-1